MKIATYKIILLTTFAYSLSCNNDRPVRNRNISEDNLSPASANFNIHWADSNYWDDGKAEVAVYDATRTIYKKERVFEYTYITVSEDFNKEFGVKTDNYRRKDLYRVMKLNAFARISTDNYPYHFLSNLFFMRNNSLMLHKFTTSSQEWCGSTFKEFVNRNDSLTLHFHSYWDGEGDGSRTFAKDMLLEDQLPYTLRSLNFKSGLTFNAPLLNTQITNKAGKPEIYRARFLVSLQDTAWKVSVKLDTEKTNEYFFSRNYPNILLKQTTWDGRNLQLKKISRYAYWQK